MSGSEKNCDIFSRVTRTFHVVVVQDNVRQRNILKSVLHVQGFCLLIRPT